MFFGKFGSRNIRKQIIFFLTPHPAILKKTGVDIIHHQKKRIGSPSYLYLIRSDYLLFFPAPWVNNESGTSEEFSSLNEIRGDNRMERRLTEKREGGDEEGKKRPRHGTEGLRKRENSKKVSGLIIWPPITSKNTIRNGLSALLRACRPGRLVLVCRAMEK